LFGDEAPGKLEAPSPVHCSKANYFFLDPAFLSIDFFFGAAFVAAFFFAATLIHLRSIVVFMLVHEKISKNTPRKFWVLVLFCFSFVQIANKFVGKFQILPRLPPPIFTKHRAA
jgi:hypothetical protein